jgi:hypothetical protein
MARDGFRSKNTVKLAAALGLLAIKGIPVQADHFYCTNPSGGCPTNNGCSGYGAWDEGSCGLTCQGAGTTYVSCS